MAVVAVVAHPDRTEAAELAARVDEWLTGRGHQVRSPDSNGALDSDGLDLAVALGGDGTMLRSVDLVCGSGVPVLGVNVGHLGYLTEVDPAGLDDALERFFAGDYTVEPRMTLEVELQAPAGAAVASWTALNEAVLDKTVSGHTVRLAVSIDDRFFTTYAADGLIVATATGSTAYNLSARGPIVSPQLRAMLLTPVSPHMLFDRSLVLDPAQVVRLEVLDGPAATLVVDGRTVTTLPVGAVVRCRSGRHDARLVTFGDRDFHRILKTKFGLADR
ncbi:MAG TPA: NAD(+)/NADH kinase [Acidimicrobiales bacterium]|nr:NAD(+)/NADH kinase [Acidimicrobiales bacterium]